MNCKQGNLAIVVKSFSNNEGKIVRCVKSVIFEYCDAGTLPAWITEPMLKNAVGCRVPIADEQLRPIRDNDGQDETLSWLDVPSKEVA